MKLKTCLVCNSTQLKKSHTITYANKVYYYDSCNECTFTFQNPWPSKDIENIYNDTNYWNSTDVYNEREKNNNNLSNNSYASYQNQRADEAKKRYKKLQKFLISKGSVLEIGCSNGIFLTEWKKNGWKCLGVDPAKEMINLGVKNFGLDLRAEKWEDLYIENESQDCIFMWGTDSNFYDFEGGFQKIYNSLKRNGICALTYQDFRHPIRKIFKQIKLQHHVLYNFSKKSILYYLESLGFEILEHSLTWQNTKLSHIKKILGMDTGGIDFKITLPAISYNMIIVKKI